MNRWWYAWLIRTVFSRWLRKALGGAARPFLVQDHERCLWAAEPRQAMLDVGICLLENFPKCSQDLNPIEVAWREVRARLAATEPTAFENRARFIARLRNAVAWVNQNRAGYLRYICSAQKEWAQDVLDQKGARTSH